MTLPIRIVLCECNSMFSDSFRLMINVHSELQLCGVATIECEVLPLVTETDPDIMVVGFHNHEVTKSLCCRLQESHSHIPVMVWGYSDEPHLVSAILQTGIRSYILKSSYPQQLVQSIVKVHKGGTDFSDGISHIVVMHMAGKLPTQLLNREQMDLVKMICQGKTSAQIAGKLFLTEAAIEVRRKNLMSLLGLKNAAELIAYAHKYCLHKIWMVMMIVGDGVWDGWVADAFLT